MGVEHSPIKTQTNSSDLKNLENRIMEQFALLQKQYQDTTSKLAADFQKSVQDCVQKSVELENKVCSIESNIKTAMNKISNDMNHHSNEIAQLFYLQHANELQLLGVPEIQNENLIDFFIKICGSLGISNPPKIRSSFRIKSGKVSRTGVSGIIIYKFLNVDDRNEVLHKYFQDPAKLTTKILGYSTNIRIYFQEYLHTTLRPIYNMAQQFKRNHRVHKV